MSYWRTFYHLIWTTKFRLPVLVNDRTVLLERIFTSVAREDRALIHAIGVMPEHVHIALSIPPSVAVSDVVKHLKGNSSRQLGRQESGKGEDWSGWQGSYGVITFGERSLPTVVHYVRNQEKHHQGNSLWSVFEIDTENENFGDPSEQ